NGGNVTLLDVPFQNVALDNISRDRTELLVGNFTGAELDQPLWGVPIVGGTPRRFADVPGEDGTWVPNGKLLVAQQNRLIQVDAGGARSTFAQLSDELYTSWWLRWSPDWHKLRFTAASNIHNTIWEVSADGTQLRNLLAKWKGADDPQQGTWTPDGKYFVFQAWRGGRS